VFLEQALPVKNEQLSEADKLNRIKQEKKY
jgi:hypothetical protein